MTARAQIPVQTGAPSTRVIGPAVKDGDYSALLCKSFLFKEGDWRRGAGGFDSVCCCRGAGKSFVNVYFSSSIDEIGFRETILWEN